MSADPFDPFADPPPAATAPAPPTPPPAPQPEPPAPEPTAPAATAPEAAAPVEPDVNEWTDADAQGEPTAADLEPAAPDEPGDPPIVNREGAPVAESAPAPYVEPQEPAQEPTPTPPAPQEPPAPVQAPQEPPVAPVAPPEPTPPAPEPAAPDNPAAPASTGATEASSNGSQPDTPQAPGPNDPKKGFRHYVVLYQTGQAEFTKVNLATKASDPTLKDFIRRVEEPAAKEGDAPTVDYLLEARNNDHAYKLCFTLLGRPDGGVTVLPLPKASWRPRRVAPAPPAPERERLTIS